MAQLLINAMPDSFDTLSPLLRIRRTAVEEPWERLDRVLEMLLEMKHETSPETLLQDLSFSIAP